MIECHEQQRYTVVWCLNICFVLLYTEWCAAQFDTDDTFVNKQYNSLWSSVLFEKWMNWTIPFMLNNRSDMHFVLIVYLENNY